MKALQIVSLPDRSRLEARGWTFTPFSESPEAAGPPLDWASFHTVSLEPGSVRGNHVHPRVTEWLLFCGGPFLVVWQDEGSETIQQKQITDHHTFLIIPAPGQTRRQKHRKGLALSGGLSKPGRGPG